MIPATVAPAWAALWLIDQDYGGATIIVFTLPIRESYRQDGSIRVDAYTIQR